MGEFYRDGSYGAKIRCFEPDDTDTVFYIPANYSSPTLRELIKMQREVPKRFV